MSGKTYVYAIAIAGRDLVKIGISRSPSKRLSTLQTASPFPIEVVCAFDLPSKQAAAAVENDLHETLKEERLAGEWFALPAVNASFLIDENVEAWKVQHIAGYADKSTWEYQR